MASLSLEIVEGPGAGRQAELTAPVVIGRAPDVELRLDDRQVSRRHARIAPAEETAVIEDLGSSNGTYVNGQQLHVPTTVSAGDEIMVGVTLIELRTERDIDARPSAVRPVPPPLAVPQRMPSYVDVAIPPEVADATPALERLRDIHVKSQAKTAPLAVFVLVTLVILVYVATR